MCTTRLRRRRPGRRHDAGFTLIELLVALALSLVLAAALGRLWVSTQQFGVVTADRVVWDLQSRVAVARLEHDLRSATAVGAPDVGCRPVLEAGHEGVTVLSDPSSAGTPEVVRWEMADGRLMRRRAPLVVLLDGAVVLPDRFSDNKTMLETVPPGAGFSYELVGAGTVQAVATDELWRVHRVVLSSADRTSLLEARAVVGQ